MLAQITNSAGFNGLPDPNSASSIGWVVVVLVAIITGLNQALKLKGQLFPTAQETRISPQPVQVQEAQEVMTKRDCRAAHTFLEQQLTEIRISRERDAKEGSASRREIYQQIDKVRIELTEKIEEMPHQIIALLRNTGAIK